MNTLAVTDPHIHHAWCQHLPVVGGENNEQRSVTELSAHAAKYDGSTHRMSPAVFPWI